MTAPARWIGRVCTAIVAACDWLRRRGRKRVALPLPRLLCEACERNPATEAFRSELEARDVPLCVWCAKRFRRVNETMASSIRTRPRKGGGGGRAA